MGTPRPAIRRSRMRTFRCCWHGRPVYPAHPRRRPPDTCCDHADDWPVEKAAAFLLGQLKELRATHPGRRVALIADGEVGSPVIGNGIGGRNSAFVLACVDKIAGRRLAILSAGTDGIDGNSPAAGAVADGETLERARTMGMDADDAFREATLTTFCVARGCRHYWTHGKQSGTLDL